MEQSIDKPFIHRSFEERLAKYNGEISVCDFDWGNLEENLEVIENECNIQMKEGCIFGD